MPAKVNCRLGSIRLSAAICVLKSLMRLETASAFVNKYWKDRLQSAGAGTRDSKTALQEWAHTRTSATPFYVIADRSGPDHDPIFTVEVKVEGIESCKGQGRSKRAAEQSAAQAVLLREKVWIMNKDGFIEENTK